MDETHIKGLISFCAINSIANKTMRNATKTACAIVSRMLNYHHIAQSAIGNPNNVD
jgi:hypothetical protein